MVEPNSPQYPNRDRFTFLEAAYIIADNNIPAKYLIADLPHVVNERLQELWSDCCSLARKMEDVFKGEKKFTITDKEVDEQFEALKKQHLFFDVAYAGFSSTQAPDKRFLETEVSREDIMEWCVRHNFKPKEFFPELREPAASQNKKPTIGKLENKRKRKPSEKKNAISKKGFHVSCDDYSTVYMNGKQHKLDTERRREIVQVLHKKDDWMIIGDIQKAVSYKQNDHIIKASFKGTAAEKIKNALLENDKKGHWRIRKP